ncbi:MAG: carboxypeptidase-like regulatory domain-containing protein [Bacteroidota bacterium]
MFKQFILTSGLILLAILSNAQTGKINGKIVDAKTGETLPGATVLIEGTTKGASSDFDGNFSLAGLQPGKYTIIASYITYDNKKFVDVVVKANDVTEFNITLDQSSSQTLNEVVVQAEMNKENTNTVLVMQKNNASVSDGISSESIKKTPDRTTSDVIKRISGATIQDNKFAIIRGMSDRYNAAFINGAPLPSSESDKKAFSFDIFPANLLDNIVILKTATPDLPGDFAGGVIQINTKSIPEKNYQSIAIGAGYNTQTTFKDFKTYEGGKMDWIGIDDGKRAIAGGIPTTRDFPQGSSLAIKDEQVANAKLVNYDWSLKTKQALPNMNLQYALANVGKIFKREAGSIFAITYNNNSSTTFVTRRDFTEQGANTGLSDEVVKNNEYQDSTYSNTILASALWNLAYKIHENHQIGLKNLYSINSDDRVVARRGAVDYNLNKWERSSVRWFTQNQIYSGQLNGDHLIEKAKLKIKWVVGYSDIKRELPNLRTMRYTKSSILQNVENDSIPYTAVIATGNSTSADNAGTMLFTTTKENIKSAKYDISRVFKIKKTTHDLKIGGNHVLRDRTFEARFFGYGMYRKNSSLVANTDLLLLDETKIFQPENMGVHTEWTGPKDGGFLLVEATTPKDNYSASAMLHAGYLQLDSRIFNNKLRFIYGARVESYNQKITYYLKPDTATTQDSTVIDILPSINAVYSLTDKINIRLAYYRTVSRPEFRELVPFAFRDFNTSFVVYGNTTLVRALIDNYDIRGEWYPGAGQIVSVSGFYKRITNATEMAVDAAGQIKSLTFVNVPLVENLGCELEYRFKLSTIFNTDSSKILDNLTIFSNFAFIQSKVDVSKIIGTTSGTRPLQGQSPYIINAGIQYIDNDKGWGASISYNVIGRRIVLVGNDNEPDYYEAPRNVLDLQLSKTFKQKFEIKLNIRDILAQRQVWYQDINKNGKLDKASESESKNLSHSTNTDNVMFNTKLAPTISLSFAYKF